MARPTSLADRCNAAVPELIVCGGAGQTLVLAPADVIASAWFNESRNSAGVDHVVEHARKEVVICQEIAEVPIMRVMKQLVGTRRDYGELADRLHTRIDIDWPPLCLAGLD